MKYKRKVQVSAVSNTHVNDHIFWNQPTVGVGAGTLNGVGYSLIGSRRLEKIIQKVSKIKSKMHLSDVANLMMSMGAKITLSKYKAFPTTNPLKRVTLG